ncbi:uncharacterized protein LOC117316925 [Pecten maximus]|uniref:uncharacterized protein LOC117316925 n=1 Tax=Pecten maximus TaxID=6579 RepID=UPI001459156B|nr:uncharacterized protein LOC117316925 [Pecten maximus]XP_033727593.1 uncharacterized protein LOC117316925 [Pecten maximus]
MMTCVTKGPVKYWICFTVLQCILFFYLFSHFEISTRGPGKSLKKQTPSITLFSAWKTFPERYAVFNNTLRNWPSLQPHVKLYLFTNDFIPGLKEYEKLGWTVLPVLREIEGHAVIKDLFRRVMQLQPDSKLYALVNGDLLLTNSFLKNLHDIIESPFLKDKTFFLTGRKLKIPNVTREEASSWENIERAAKRGVLDQPYLGIDYYITPPSYHWRLIPDLQFLRPHYDTWMIWDARRMGLVVIDATNTLLAPHQNAPHPKDPVANDNNMKYIVASRSELGEKGAIWCCEFETALVNGTVTVQRRNNIPKQCIW